MHGRVMGGPAVDSAEQGLGAAFIPNREATVLRVRDLFPRLPLAMWGRRTPYLVVLDICVTVNGDVDAATLRSSASPELDPLVLAAAHGWRYRARVVHGEKLPFCHRVAIQYERW
jgi:hypothetical protein